MSQISGVSQRRYKPFTETETATARELNARFDGFDLRLRRLEDQGDIRQEAVSRIVELGLERVEISITPVTQEARDLIGTVRQELEALLAQVAARLEELQLEDAYTAAQVDALIRDQARALSRLSDDRHRLGGAR